MDTNNKTLCDLIKKEFLTKILTLSKDRKSNKFPSLKPVKFTKLPHLNFFQDYLRKCWKNPNFIGKTLLASKKSQLISPNHLMYKFHQRMWTTSSKSKKNSQSSPIKRLKNSINQFSTVAVNQSLKSIWQPRALPANKSLFLWAVTIQGNLFLYQEIISPISTMLLRASNQTQ